MARKQYAQIVIPRLHVSQQRSAVAYSLEVVQCQLDTDAAGDSNQMQHDIGWATKNHGQNHGVLKSFAGHNITGLDILLQQVANSLACVQTFLDLLRVAGGSWRTVG